MNTALTIAGSDSSGGAGIQADIKTMQANGVFAMSAVTALTAQNTVGVQGIFEVTPEFLAQQISSVFSDIRPDAVKIGMVSSAELIHVIAQQMTSCGAERLVIDPVMIATSGARLMAEDAIDTFKSELAPLASILTPNIPEAEILSGMKITDDQSTEACARHLARTFGCSVLLKGGHGNGSDCDDLLCTQQSAIRFPGRRIDTKNTHGTGCTLSSAIAANLAKGFSMEDSVRRAKEYLTGALAAGLNLGSGSGPLNHGYDIRSRFTEEAVKKP